MSTYRSLLGVRTDAAGTMISPKRLVEFARHHGITTLGTMDVTGWLSIEPLVEWLLESDEHRLVLGREVRTRDGVDLGFIALNDDGWRALCDVPTDATTLELIAWTPPSVLLTSGCPSRGVLHASDEIRTAWRKHQGPKAVTVPLPEIAQLTRVVNPWKQLADTSGAPLLIEHAAMALPGTPYWALDIWSEQARPESTLRRLGTPCVANTAPSIDVALDHDHVTSVLEYTNEFARKAGVGRNSRLVRSWTTTRQAVASSSETIDQLRTRVLENLHARNDPLNDATRARIELELELLARAGWAETLLQIDKVVQAWTDQQITLGPGRGSAINLLCAYALGITHIDPRRWHLSPYAALSPERHDPPDIDIDVCSSDHAKAQAIVGTTRFAVRHTLTERSAIIRAANDLDAGYQAGLRLANLPRDKWVSTLGELGCTNPEALAARIDTLRTAITDVCERIDQHVSGMVLPGLAPSVPVPIEAGLVRFPTHLAENAGLVKLDVLSLVYLDLLVEAASLAKVPLPDPSAADTDEPTWDALSHDPPYGIFQVTDSNRRFVTRAAPRSIGELAATLALVRPGVSPTTRSAFVARHRRAFDDLQRRLTEVVPWGLIIFRDDIGRILERVAGMEPAQAYADTLAPAGELARLIAANSDFIMADAQQLASRLTNAANGGYLFRHGHALAYATLAWQGAHLAVHYPEAWQIALEHRGASERTRETRTLKLVSSVPSKEDTLRWFQPL